MAIGVGAAGLPIDAGLVAVAVLGLVLAYLPWWTYFGGDEVAAEEALDRVPPQQRAMVALRAYGWAHYPILFGIVALAAGVKKAIGYAFDSLTWPQALVLAGGVAVFLVGDVAYRRVLRIGAVRFRAFGALAALATAPIGRWQAAAQLVALVLVVLAMLIWEDRAARTAPA